MHWRTCVAKTHVLGKSSRKKRNETYRHADIFCVRFLKGEDTAKCPDWPGIPWDIYSLSANNFVYDVTTEITMTPGKCKLMIAFDFFKGAQA